MPRSHIEFIHSNSMPWVKKHLDPLFKNVIYKTLSLDNDTKEMTAVLKFPKKWNQQKNS